RLSSCYGDSVDRGVDSSPDEKHAAKAAARNAQLIRSGAVDRQTAGDRQFPKSQRNDLRRCKDTRGVEGYGAARADGRDRFAQRAVARSERFARSVVIVRD